MIAAARLDRLNVWPGGGVTSGTTAAAASRSGNP